MSGEISPPLFDGVAPTGVCARMLADGPCGALATMHIIWTVEVDNAPACPRHDEEAQRWAYVGRHPYSPTCALAGRGAIWLPREDRCVLADEADPAARVHATRPA